MYTHRLFIGYGILNSKQAIFPMIYRESANDLSGFIHPKREGV